MGGGGGGGGGGILSYPCQWGGAENDHGSARGIKKPE